MIFSPAVCSRSKERLWVDSFRGCRLLFRASIDLLFLRVSMQLAGFFFQLFLRRPWPASQVFARGPRWVSMSGYIPSMPAVFPFFFFFFLL